MDFERLYDPAVAGRTPDPATVRRLQKLAYWLDDRFHIPGTGRRVGLDGLVGFIPGIGDLAAGALSAYIVAEAYRLGVPPALLIRMGVNWGLDTLLGSVPVVGDIFDIAFKANRRNIGLLLGYLEAQGAVPQEPAATATTRGAPGRGM